MEVRLLSVGTRGFFLPASRLAIAASPLNFVAPNKKKNLWHQGNFTFGLPNYVRYIEEFVISRFVISRFYSIHFTVVLVGT